MPGEATGALRSTLAVRIDDAPVLLTSIDTSLPAWSGPAGVNGAAVVANRLRLGDGDAPACRGHASPAPRCSTRHPGCRLAVATAADVTDARRSVDAVLPD